jgi:tRNA (guanine-N7-)-methyltransferase
MEQHTNTTRRFYGRRSARPLGVKKSELMETLLPKILLPIEKIKEELDPKTLWEKPYEGYAVEVGFGGGEHLAYQAKHLPHIGFIGAEPFINGVAGLLQHIDENQLTNVQVFFDDARFLVEKLKAESLKRFYILFPDPWKKKKQFKRRIVCDEMLNQIHRLLEKDGMFFLASDHPTYLEWMFAHMKRYEHMFKCIYKETERPEGWPQTRYEAKAIREGRTSYFMIFEKI